jgi:fermentation-respiration switch protein FrsA (DUF1100 family)
MTSAGLASVHLVALAAVLGCGASQHEQIRTSSAEYVDGRMWLCRPDLPSDACRIDLTTTVIEPDGTHTVETHAPAHDAAVDCFYIYPTVDLGVVPGNHTDFTDLSEMRKTAVAQIARWSEVCNVYAPLYRQVTIGTYLDKASHRRFFDVAYSDVAAAFHAYLTHFDRGKPIVVVGHSQGAQMAAQLVHDTFDQSAKLRPRLLAVMPIGSLVHVPANAPTGGTFENLPACAQPDDLGCVVTYMTVGEGETAASLARDLPAGEHAMCVNPSPGPTLGESVFPSHHEYGVTTPFAAVRGLYRARCVAHPDGRAYLEVGEQRVPGDRRPSPVSLHPLLGAFGLHVYDFQFTQGDLIELVRRKLAAWQAGQRK